jgi:epoxyqueuosine reductase
MEIDTFFQEEGINEYSIVRIEDLPVPDPSGPLDLVPGARSVIVFGAEVPVPYYDLPPHEKTKNMLRIAELLDRTAARLVDRLVAENFRSAVVPLFLPLCVKSGQVQGIVRLKHVASCGGLGTIGKSTILLSPRYGTRLALSGVVTAMEGDSPKISPGQNFCHNCELCVQSCPGKAISPLGVDAFRCRNISPWIPTPFIPAARWLLSREAVQRLVAPCAHLFARHASMQCSLCVTVCPCFKFGEKTKV